jgi:hypothetical protein
MYTIFPHVCAKYCLSELSDNAVGILAHFWDQDSKATLAQKLKDKKKYDEELRAAFDEPTKRGSSSTSEAGDQGESIDGAGCSST